MPVLNMTRLRGSLIKEGITVVTMTPLNSNRGCSYLDSGSYGIWIFRNMNLLTATVLQSSTLTIYGIWAEWIGNWVLDSKDLWLFGYSEI